MHTGKGSQISLSKTPKNMDDLRVKAASGMKEKSSSVVGLKDAVKILDHRPFITPQPPLSLGDGRFKSFTRSVNTPAPGHYNPRYQSIYKGSNQMVMTSHADRFISKEVFHTWLNKPPTLSDFDLSTTMGKSKIGTASTMHRRIKTALTSQADLPHSMSGMLDWA